MPLPVLEVPSYETILPSTKKPIKFRPFLVKEHKVLLMMKEGDSKDIARIVTEIIDACTFKKLNMDQLAFFDLVHLFIELRKASIGDTLDLIVNCECGKKIETQTSLSKTTVINSPEHQTRVLLTRNVAVDLRYPHLDEGLEAYMTTDPDKVIEIVTRCIIGVHKDNEFFDARDSTREELVEFLENLNTKQLESLMKFFSTMPRVVLDVVTDCPSCKKHHDLKLEGLDNFFV